MGTEFLVASLWAVVLIYWFWSRRPTTGDTVGLFRHELSVLQRATPTRVAPANRRCVSGPAPVGRPFLPAAAPGTDVTTDQGRDRPVPARSELPTPLMAAALSHKRMELRRRRRDIISVLLVAVVVTVLAVVLTRSLTALAFQGASDVALTGYAYLLVRATRAEVVRVPRPRFGGSGRRLSASPVGVPPQLVAASVAPAAYDGQEFSRYMPPHTLGRPAYSMRSYGDFDSYASLALDEERLQGAAV